MVAKITSPHSIKRALNYNEQKVLNGNAYCIAAGNYLQDLADLNFYDKLSRFQNLISLNDRSKKSNVLHISLNFDPSEKLDENTLSVIAGRYMEKIGFGLQPFLVYRHTDAAHPHIHIVTTTITSDGSRIDTFNIGRNQSEFARKEIEIEFGLMRAGSGASKSILQPDLLIPDSIQYGKSETKRSITNVLDQVMEQYKYTSLPSFNAVLNSYNIMADAGRMGGRIHSHGGLVYHIIDSHGNKMGVPIKASSIYSQPTLRNLESKFRKNVSKRLPNRLALKAAIDEELNLGKITIDQLIEGLSAKEISTIIRRNVNGLPYGVTFVDHRTKAVFNGSELGKQYSIGSLVSKLAVLNEMVKARESANDCQRWERPKQLVNVKDRTLPGNILEKKIFAASLVEQLLKNEGMNALPPHALKAKRKKKKRKLNR